jgi:large subunit ribosomal protein L24
MKMKIRKGDTVEIISGRFQDKGKRGEVIRVLPGEGRVVVSGINIRKKHQRQVQSRGRTMSPGIIEFEAPIDVSNVMLICPKCDEPSRMGVQRNEQDLKRVCKNCGALVD